MPARPRKLLSSAFAALLAYSPAYADSLGSATGGPAGNQSNLSGGLCQSAPIALTNSQQASVLIDCTTHALITEGTGGGGASSVTLLPGTAIAGKVGIDQTTPGTTNGVQTLSGSVTTATITPSSSNTIGVTAVVSGSAGSSLVLKNAAGNLYGAYATNLTSTAGYLEIFNATSAPSDGAVTPIACVALPPTGTANISRSPGPPQVYSTGITAVVSSANTCFTKTTGTITAFFSGDVQ